MANKYNWSYVVNKYPWVRAITVHEDKRIILFKDPNVRRANGSWIWDGSYDLIQVNSDEYDIILQREKGVEIAVNSKSIEKIPEQYLEYLTKEEE